MGSRLWTPTVLLEQDQFFSQNWCPRNVQGKLSFNARMVSAPFMFKWGQACVMLKLAQLFCIFHHFLTPVACVFVHTMCVWHFWGCPSQRGHDLHIFSPMEMHCTLLKFSQQHFFKCSHSLSPFCTLRVKQKLWLAGWQTCALQSDQIFACHLFFCH